MKLEPEDDLIANFSPRKIKHLDERARELYHSLGSSCLHKMTEFFSLKKDLVEETEEPNKKIGKIRYTHEDAIPVVNVVVRKVV